MRYVVLCGSSVLVATFTTFVLNHLLSIGIGMTSRNYITLMLANIATSISATEVDLGWHPPKKSWVNNLGQILNGTETNGFIFNSSQLPAGVEYGTYNWCNMPHVRKEEYVKADDDFQLFYVEM